MHISLPTAHLRLTLCRNSRESCSTPEVPLLCTSYFQLPTSELRCAATRARAALYWKILCYAHPTSYCLSTNYVVPQLARELVLRKFLCYPLPASHLRITLCRNSRENCCFKSSFAIHFPPPISELRYAATRVEAALYWIYSLLLQHIMPQLVRELLLRKFLCHPPPTFSLRIMLCRNSRRSYSILQLLFISAAHYAATRAKTISYCSHSLLSNHITPESHESCFRLRVLLISEPTSCRNSR